MSGDPIDVFRVAFKVTEEPPREGLSKEAVHSVQYFVLDHVRAQRRPPK